jgi:hypothetical protein
VMWGHRNILAPSHILHSNNKQCLQLEELGIYNPLPQPKIQMTIDTRELEVGPMVTGGERQEVGQLL